MFVTHMLQATKENIQMLWRIFTYQYEKTNYPKEKRTKPDKAFHGKGKGQYTYGKVLKSPRSLRNTNENDYEMPFVVAC